ncbi:MAG: hypothetical protein L6R37_002656 [Teloschistes peruensis]|nr:MAG: hypothetical protein L6R37_002656 [Teloschistes peruensis]
MAMCNLVTTPHRTPAEDPQPDYQETHARRKVKCNRGDWFRQIQPDQKLQPACVETNGSASTRSG